MNIFVCSLALSALASQVQNSSTPAPAPVTVVITDLPSTTSTVKLNFYNSAASFLKSGQAALRKVVKPSGQDRVTVKVELPPGEWAIALSQDTNDNGKLDRNFLGIPTEPYAFSNNVRPHLKAPRFEECKFAADGAGKVITIRMEE